jgi:hypothetical protein
MLVCVLRVRAHLLPQLDLAMPHLTDEHYTCVCVRARACLRVRVRDEEIARA